MARLNVLKTIEKTRGHIDERYDIRADDLMIISKAYKDKYRALSSAFELGYAQGRKSAQAENKREKQIMLSEEDAKRLDIYLELTSSRITEEKKLWESLRGDAPAADRNINFWNETAVVVSKLRKQLR